MVVGDYYEDNVRIEVYDFILNIWCIIGNYLLIVNYMFCNVFCNGFYFWVIWDLYGVIVFNM